MLFLAGTRTSTCPTRKEGCLVEWYRRDMAYSTNHRTGPRRLAHARSRRCLLALSLGQPIEIADRKAVSASERQQFNGVDAPLS
jgi:hypothetical protein